MKRIIIILIAALTGLYVILSIAGSDKEYAAEKLFYSAVRTGNKIAANPDVAPPKLLDDIENKLKKLLERYPDTEVAKTVNIKLAEFYITYKKYDQALAHLDKVVKKYEKNRGILSTACFLKGVAYEKQDKWPSALKEYHAVRDDYRDTQLGMQVPLYIADHYSKEGKEPEALEAYGEAERFYERIEKENSAKALGYMASLFLIQAYIKSSDFENAGRVVEETLNKYYSRMALLHLLPLVENVIVTKLNRPEKGTEIYKSILQKTKDEKLKKVLQKRLNELSGKKSG